MPPLYLQMKKPGKEPNPMVQVSVQDVTRESKVGRGGQGLGCRGWAGW